MENVIELFRDAIRAAGFEPPEAIEPGRLHRFPTNGRRDDDSGWCTLFEDGLGGVFGDFRSNLRGTWQAKREKPLTDAERAEFKERCKQEHRKREAEKERRHADAAKKAQEILDAAKGDPQLHPYAVEKAVPLGPLLKRGRWQQRGWIDALLIPLYDAAGTLWSIEAINSDGEKDFLKGGKKKACFHLFGHTEETKRIVIGEGIATVAAAWHATGFAGIAAMDAGNIEPVARAVKKLIPGSDLVFLADNDVGGKNTGIESATKAARAVGGKIAVAELDGHKCDFWDVYHERGAETVKAAIANARSLDIKINVGNQDLPQVTKLAWDALTAANDPPQVFRHGSYAARIETDDHGYPAIRELTLDRMRHRLARVASWYTIKGKKEIEAPAKPPMDVVRDVLATPDLPLPVLSHIAEAPIFAADGTLQTESGYHPRTQSFYAPAAGFTVTAVPKQPAADDIKRARELITDDLLHDFPFTSDAEKAHAVALLLLPFVRNFIDGSTPLHLIEKPSPGTGASLLTDVLSYVATGHTAPVMTEARDEDEWRKRITAKLRGGPSVILIDNLSRRLESAAVSAAITSNVWTDRVLGHSEDVRIPVRCAWVATGNNPAVSSEIARRVVRIRLDAKLDRPWERDVKSFHHADLRGWVAEHRGEIVWSALTLAQAWLAAGRRAPKGSLLGGFEDWSRVIGGILDVSGISGFLQNLTEFYEASDDEGKAWRAFVSAWWEKFTNTDVGVSKLFEVTTGLDEPLNLGDKERSQKIRLGKLLAGARDRQFAVVINGTPASLKIVAAGTKDRAGQWKLARIEGPDPWD